MTLHTVCFISRDTFENHLKLSSTIPMIAISITDPTATSARAPKGLAGLLRLSFEDDYEELLGVPPGYLPDLHPQHDDGIRLFFGDNELCDANDASRMLSFLNTYAKKDQPHDVIVHCRAGISRSAAVAQFVSEHYGCDIDQANPDTSAANMRVLRLLRSASKGVTPTKGIIGAIEEISSREDAPVAGSSNLPDARQCVSVIVDGVKSSIPITSISANIAMARSGAW